MFTLPVLVGYPHHYHHTNNIASVLPQNSFYGHCLHHDGNAAAGCSSNLAMGTFLLSLLGITVLAILPLPKVSSSQGTVRGCFMSNERECMKEGKVTRGLSEGYALYHFEFKSYLRV
jgi:hypothetical protein